MCACVFVCVLMREMSRRSGNCVRCCLVIFAVVSALAVCGPALFWRFKKGVSLGDNKSSCPHCNCDCPPPLSLLKIAPGKCCFHDFCLWVVFKSWAWLIIRWLEWFWGVSISSSWYLWSTVYALYSAAGFNDFCLWVLLSSFDFVWLYVDYSEFE